MLNLRRSLTIALALALSSGPMWAQAQPVASVPAADWKPLFHLTPETPVEAPDTETAAALLTDSDRRDMLRDVQNTMAMDDYLSGSLAFRLPTPDELIDRIKAIRRMGMGGAGLAVSDLQTGITASQNGDAPFHPASVIKLAVMTAAYGEAQGHRLKLDRLVVVRGGNVTGTWMPPGDRRPLLHAGRKVTINQLLDLMISRSDNVATNCLIDVLGAGTINGWMRRLGFNHIQVHHKLEVGGPCLDTSGGFYRNVMTVNETARLLAQIYRRTLIDEDSSNQMLTLLSHQMDRSMIPALLPKGTRVYNKTGETAHTHHDAGIVEYKGHPYVLVVFTTGSPDHMIAAVAQLIHRLLVR